MGDRSEARGGRGDNPSPPIRIAKEIWSTTSSAESQFCVLSAGLALFGHRACFERLKFDSMITFFLSMVPSELPLHFLLIQLFVCWMYGRKLIGRHFPTPNENSRTPNNSPSTQQIQSTWSWRIRKFVFGAGIGLSSWSLFCFSKMLYHNIQSILRFRAISRRAELTSVAHTPNMLVRLLLLIVPLSVVLKRGLAMKKDVVFAEVPRSLRSTQANKKLRLNVFWHPQRKMENAPVFLYIHGGGWIIGHKDYHSLPLLYQVAHSGWIVVTANYRLVPKVRAYPEQLTDCKRALRWVREHIHEYGGNGNFVVCGGESAGGHLSSLLALTPNDKSLQPGFEEMDTTLQGCVNLYGVMDLTDNQGLYMARGNVKGFIQKVVMKRFIDDEPEVFRQASPIWRLEHVRPLPRFMVIHGTIDTLVPYGDGREFFRRLTQQRNSPTQQVEGVVEGVTEEDNGDAALAWNRSDVFVKLPSAHHAFNFVVSPRTLAMGDAVVDFLADVYARSNTSKL